MLACLLIVAVGALAAAGPAGARGGRSGLHWAMARSSLENLLRAVPRRAEREFSSPRTLVQNAPPLTRNPVPSGWGSTASERWRSYAEFAADVAAGVIPPYVTVVHYDNEAWPETPAAEQAHPIAYGRRFCGLAHSHGWSCYTGPAKDLCGVLAHPRGETYAECYLDLDLAGRSARFSDVIDIQAQSLEPRGSRAYGNFVRRAAAQAWAANPDVLILGNIAASPLGRAVPTARVLACARAALPYVGGFYTTVTPADGATMRALLSMLQRRAG